MRVLMALVLSAGAAGAECNREILTVESWTAVHTGSDIPYLEGSTRISITLATTSPHAIAMVQGGVDFHDALGREVAKISIEEDAAFDANGTFSQDGHYTPGDSDRLATVDPRHIIAETCIFSVLYADGTVERFDS